MRGYAGVALSSMPLATPAAFNWARKGTHEACSRKQRTVVLIVLGSARASPSICRSGPPKNGESVRWRTFIYYPREFRRGVQDGVGFGRAHSRLSCRGSLPPACDACTVGAGSRLRWSGQLLTRRSTCRGATMTTSAAYPPASPSFPGKTHGSTPSGIGTEHAYSLALTRVIDTPAPHCGICILDPGNAGCLVLSRLPVVGRSPGPVPGASGFDRWRSLLAVGGRRRRDS